MKRPIRHLLVQCADYNGYKNVLFMMRKSTLAERIALGISNYKVLAEGEYLPRGRILTLDDGRSFEVFSDWSVRRI